MRGRRSIWLVLGRALAVACIASGALLLSAAPAAAQALESPRVHVVVSGQRLESIARRYVVTVDALCEANGITPTTRLRVGQKLVIPAKGDDGTEAKRWGAERGVAERQEAAARRRTEAPRDSRPRPRSHRVAEGQSLGRIAKRYGLTVEELCEANRITPHTKLKPGQDLVIPSDAEASGSSRRAAEPRPTGAKSVDRARPKRSAGWKSYVRRPRKPGYVTLNGPAGRFSGFVLASNGKVLPKAREGIERVMGAGGRHPKVDLRLVRLIAKVSDTFGGRPIRVVSGFRTESYAYDSRHKHSQAVDFSIPGVPNEAVRDYLLTLSQVGVGYYPNSSFVHLDARPVKTYWVDYAGPGEAPRYAWAGRARKTRSGDEAAIVHAPEPVAAPPEALDGGLDDLEREDGSPAAGEPSSPAPGEPSKGNAASGSESNAPSEPRAEARSEHSEAG
jgi:LysM repeat protein